MPEYKKEWLERASLDYFSPFILLWLSFNSWYRSHYSDIEDGRDRSFINHMKTDFSGRNQPFRNFKTLLARADKVGMSFRSDLEMLHRGLMAAALAPDKIKYLKLEKALIDYAQKDNESGYINLLRVKPREKKENKLLLHELHVTNDFQLLYAGVLECVYQFRCMLVHGHVEPSEQTHDVSQYCYKVLLAIMP